MIERTFDIPTPDGAMNTYSVRPDDGGPLPVVLMLMDAPGVREGLREICRRISQSGYYVLLPNLYYRTIRDFASFGQKAHLDSPKASRGNARSRAGHEPRKIALLTGDIASLRALSQSRESGNDLRDASPPKWR